MFIFRVLNTVPYSNEAGAKDVIASLHSFLTSNVLVGLAVLVSWKQFGGKPIECMVPTDFTSAWVQYAENYCWSLDTYFVPFSTAVAAVDGDAEKAKTKVSYYQWMPFFLLFEAACFKLPCLIWKYFASQSGMRVGEILRIASDDHNAVPEVKKGNVHALCSHLQGALRFQKRLKLKRLVPHKILRFLNLKYSTHYVTFIYFVAKFGFLVNVGLQAKLLNSYLLPKDRARDRFGFDIWRSLWSGNQTWMNSGLFPRVTLCDFEVREMANIQTHTVQCVLLINIFTEKIFIILWAWYLILGAFTVCNLFSWVFLLFNRTAKEHFIFSRLEMSEDYDKYKENMRKKENVDKFLDKYLGLDGVFLLQLIAQHADVVFTTDLVSALWKSHRNIEDQRTALKQMDRVLPLLLPASESPSKNSKGTPKKEGKTSPDGPRIRNPRNSIAGPNAKMSMKRTISIDQAEFDEVRKYEESSSDEDEKIASRKNSRPASRRASKV